MQRVLFSINSEAWRSILNLLVRWAGTPSKISGHFLNSLDLVLIICTFAVGGLTRKLFSDSEIWRVELRPRVEQALFYTAQLQQRHRSHWSLWLPLRHSSLQTTGLSPRTSWFTNGVERHPALHWGCENVSHSSSCKRQIAFNISCRAD